MLQNNMHCLKQIVLLCMTKYVLGYIKTNIRSVSNYKIYTLFFILKHFRSFKNTNTFTYYTLMVYCSYIDKYA